MSSILGILDALKALTINLNEKETSLSLPVEKPEIGCLKVSSKSSPASVAGAIAGMVKDGVGVEIQAVGAGAVNQAVKAIAVCRGFLSPVGIDIACIPSFTDIVIDGQCRTAIRFAIDPRRDCQVVTPAAVDVAQTLEV